MVESQVIIEELIIVSALILMIYAVVLSNRLLVVLKGSKVEGVWRQSRILVVILVIVFFFFSLIRLLATIDKDSDSFELPQGLYNLGIGETHNLMMNSSFLLTSLLLISIFRVDNRAYTALFELISEK